MRFFRQKTPQPDGIKLQAEGRMTAPALAEAATPPTAEFERRLKAAEDAVAALRMRVEGMELLGDIDAALKQWNGMIESAAAELIPDVRRAMIAHMRHVITSFEKGAP